MKACMEFPQDYHPLLGLRQTEQAIRQIKEFFQTNLAFELNLMRVTAPLFVLGGTGINDDLNGVERPVAFPVKSMQDSRAEIVQSLAKWKRLQLADFGMQPGEGLYTDMNAIRPDEELDNLHSIYVDQWDWERVIRKEERNVDFLKQMVSQIYAVIRAPSATSATCTRRSSPSCRMRSPSSTVKTCSERYPDLTPKERERLACQEHGAIFVIGIGAALPGGKPHDGRAPDYDDWSTPTDNGYKGLNGDILVNYPLLDCAYELSSMGIRVDPPPCCASWSCAVCMQRKDLFFHRRLLNDELPLSIGGGIGQSRLCMFYLRKAHIGEIQSSLWPREMVEQCQAHNITLL